MTTYLLKTEPDVFSYDDLVRAKREPWDGVRNPTAQMHMRAMRKGDEALIYHTGNERAIAGLSKVVRGAYPEPGHEHETTAKGEPKYVLVDLSPVRAAPEKVTLAMVKGDGRFGGFDLITQSRLSVMPVPAAFDALLREMAGL